MTTDLDTSTLRKNAPLFWFTLAKPIAIIAVGIYFVFNPIGASTGYGISIHDPAAFPFMWIKGIRDIFAGLIILSFLFSGDRRTTAVIFAISILSRSAMGWSFCDILALHHPSRARKRL